MQISDYAALIETLLLQISESKMKAFNIGTMNLAKKGMSKREQEEHKRRVRSG